MRTDEQYLGDNSLWGDYQYKPLKELINTYLASQGEDDYSYTDQRTRIVAVARRGVAELSSTAARTVKAREIVLNSSLQVAMPQDYINYVRISTVDEKGFLRPVTVNPYVVSVDAYLQDNNLNILFDSDGFILTDETKPSTVGLPTIKEDVSDVREYSFRAGEYAFNPNVDRSLQNYTSVVVEDKANGRFMFDSSMEEKSIVLEYISDGLYQEGGDGEIRIHKFAEEALYRYITYILIKDRRHVPANEKARAKRDYYVMKKNVKKRMNSMRKSDLEKAFRGYTVWNRA